MLKLLTSTLGKNNRFKTSFLSYYKKNANSTLLINWNQDSYITNNTLFSKNNLIDKKNVENVNEIDEDEEIYKGLDRSKIKNGFYVDTPLLDKLLEKYPDGNFPESETWKPTDPNEPLIEFYVPEKEMPTFTIVDAERKKNFKLDTSQRTKVINNDRVYYHNIYKPEPEKKKEKLRHSKSQLSKEEIKKIIELRTADPENNTQKKLAKQFKCTGKLIAMLAPCPDERKEELFIKKSLTRVHWRGRDHYRRWKLNRDAVLERVEKNKNPIRLHLIEQYKNSIYHPENAEQ
eukprot:TRINITY_DN14411_c0_g1_i1.p1 TRINITY_DN14411_c0_g1~~TRINITY_DN14411_c0_g1_i1.p1  ORF type:complete len:289 (-),score=75.06 TRINITY_DN14411_c0_g1_i1:94-960(-)